MGDLVLLGVLSRGLKESGVCTCVPEVVGSTPVLGMCSGGSHLVTSHARKGLSAADSHGDRKETIPLAHWDSGLHEGAGPQDLGSGHIWGVFPICSLSLPLSRPRAS